MKRILLAFALLIVCMHALPAHTLAQTTPLQFSDRMAVITDSLFSKGQQWGLAFREVNENKNYASLRTTREALERFIDNKIVEVTKMKDVQNSKDLRMAMISFLSFERTMSLTALKPIESLPKTATEAQVQAALDNMTEQSKQEAVELQKVAAAQDAYAKANDFTLETAATEGKK